MQKTLKFTLLLLFVFVAHSSNLPLILDPSNIPVSAILNMFEQEGLLPSQPHNIETIACPDSTSYDSGLQFTNKNLTDQEGLDI